MQCHGHCRVAAIDEVFDSSLGKPILIPSPFGYSQLSMSLKSVLQLDVSGRFVNGNASASALRVRGRPMTPWKSFETVHAKLCTLVHFDRKKWFAMPSIAFSNILIVITTFPRVPRISYINPGTASASEMT